MPLTMVNEGMQVVLLKINEEKKLKKRLQDLGLFDGVKFDVISNDMRGPFIINVMGSKLVLDRGTAQKIIVREAR
ncbi:FeoA family protein [Clostridium grantii]|uniref:Ferrous iron transport protein A n=1 Tax=Clostridium grantii DSM 8605 TaxID=1121316 RepID=A0A1M5V471_9CLOT|nr:FeoA family protein [Clostridium grantii]SHH70057.1 ferrous iron transport protein A [Clostridium grantii DSM 8605]